MSQGNDSGELVANSGFEKARLGAAANWDITPFVSALSPVSMSGAYSLKIQANELGSTPIAAQNITKYKNGQMYRLQYNVRTDRPGVQYRIYTEFWDDKLGWVSLLNGEFLKGSGAWQKVTANFKSPPQSTRIGTIVQVIGPGTAWFDNISIAPVSDTTVPSPPVAIRETRAAAGIEPGVTIAKDLRFRIDGRPFFPLRIWGWVPQSEEELKQARDFGYNVVGGPIAIRVGAEAMRLWMDAAQRQGVYGTPLMGMGFPADGTAEKALASLLAETEKVMPAMRNHPALFGYQMIDEPAWGGYDVAANNKAAQWLKAQDPTHLVLMNHAPQNTVEELKRYNPFIDASGSDIYPIRWDGIGYHSSLPNKSISVVGDETRKNLVAVDYKKPVMQTLQAFSWTASKPGDKLFPSPHESRFMAWDSVLGGATGISWFQNEAYPYLHSGVKQIVREFAALQDVLAGGTRVSTKGVFASPLQTIAYRWKGKTVLIATNPTNRPVQLAVNWQPAFGKSKAPLRVLWENRKIAAKEMFGPHDVRIYTDAAQNKEILRTEFAVDAAALTSKKRIVAGQGH